MTAARYADRLERSRRGAAGADLAGILVTPGPDLAYLTGYAPLPLERLTLLVVAVGRDPVLLVPELERPGALASLGDLALEVLGWADGTDPYATAARLLPAGRFALSDRTWASHVIGLERAAPEVSLTTIGGALPLLRAVKDEDELLALRAVAASADATYEGVVDIGFEGRREIDLAADLADLLLANGHETVDFTIVASGANGASPHHEAGERVIGVGDLIVMDFGGHRSGYCSDISRTVVVGEPTAEQRRVHDTVLVAQQAGFEAVRPGVACEQIDAAARAVIEGQGFGDAFVHRTGHGIGIDVHEPPYIVAGDRTPLEAGMTFSIEPGIYLAGRFGVRIEDIVAVTETGADRLNRAPRDLAVVA